jgi:hypothetical protein
MSYHQIIWWFLPNAYLTIRLLAIDEVQVID